MQTELLEHVLDARQFSRDWLEGVLFPLAAELQQTLRADLPRTLGGSVAGMDADEHSADAESLEDRIRVLNEYPYDFLLLRSQEEGGARRAAAVSRVPIINAGDGPGQHPTQALLDAYTLWREFGHIDGLRMALVGDLSYERTTNSLAYLLGRFEHLTMYLVAPQLLRMRDEVREYLRTNGVSLHEVLDLRTVVDDLDVIYMTRAQSARFAHARRFDPEPGLFGVDQDVLDRLTPQARILHPLPRGEELPKAFDNDPRIACFRQAGNGLYVRMALLTLLTRGPRA